VDFPALRNSLHGRQQRAGYEKQPPALAAAYPAMNPVTVVTHVKEIPHRATPNHRCRRRRAAAASPNPAPRARMNGVHDQRSLQAVPVTSASHSP